MIEILKYDDFISELFGTIPEIVHKQTNLDHNFLFNIGDDKYVAKCVDLGGDTWLYKFFHYDLTTQTYSDEMTNIGKTSFRVLSACKEIFTEFTQAFKPKLIFIICDKNNSSRIRLYDKFCDDICTKCPNLTKKVKDYGIKHVFILHEPSINGAFISSKALQIINTI
jgi:hypothetical protein